jgi:SWI2/SNF2 ATPase
MHPTCPLVRFPDRHLILSEHRDILVIAGEVHSSLYDFIDSFARPRRDALLNVSFTDFAGTPIELAEASTRVVFGDYIRVHNNPTTNIPHPHRISEFAIAVTIQVFGNRARNDSPPLESSSDGHPARLRNAGS